MTPSDDLPDGRGVNALYRREPFELGEGRAMVSLGRLTTNRHCTYRCPFCYVNADYQSFGSRSPEQITDWVRRQEQDSFDVIYVSGDTDSFAPPRQSTGIELLERLAPVGKDLLFTTRAIFDEPALARLEELNRRLRADGRWLFGCVSICQWTVPRLEPMPIAEPSVRAGQLVELSRRGLVAVLALRPFLPVVPLNDYSAILDACGTFVDLVLGEDWYADQGGRLEQAVLGAPSVGPYIIERMPFDTNVSEWRVYKLEEHESHVREQCAARGLPFFMRSGPALNHWRESRAQASGK